jgi:hypothetical protein
MSDITPTDAELNKLLDEYKKTCEKREEIWKQRNACFFRLCKTEDEVKREILETELKNIEAHYRDIEDTSHMLYLLYSTWLNSYDIDDYGDYDGDDDDYYSHFDKEDQVIGNRC